MSALALTRPLLGVDGAMHRTGVALWGPADLRAVAPGRLGTVRVPNKVTGHDGLVMAAEVAALWCRKHLVGLPPGTAVIEAPWSGGGKTSAAALQAVAWVGGSWAALLKAFSWDVVLVHQSTWKAFFKAKGSRLERATTIKRWALMNGVVEGEATPDGIDGAMVATWWRLKTQAGRYGL